MNKNKPSSNLSSHSHSRLSFDKIIDYFEGYLNKHKLVIAREMKSVRDLFKVQPRIDYKKIDVGVGVGVGVKRKVVTEGKELEKLEFLPMLGDDVGRERKNSTRRKDTRRSDRRERTDRSQYERVEQLLSYKSQ